MKVLLLLWLWAMEPRWAHLSSARGELPNPGGSTQQTGILIADLDGNKTDDAVISYRVHGPALVWIRKTEAGWKRTVIEPEFLPLEAGGAANDIDRDGDLDIVFGEDSKGNRMWWWENPGAKAEGRWTRHVIKDGGANQHHDQLFADVLGTGRAQLVFWNQRAKELRLAEVPEDARSDRPWASRVVFSGASGEGVDRAASYAEGLHAFDVDGDGRLDLLAGNRWFRYANGVFEGTEIGPTGGRIRAGRFGRGKVVQVVIAPGDGSGPLLFYECTGNPRDAKAWRGRRLLSQEMVHGHTLDTGDIDGDGHLDIFAGEMAKWSNKAEVDHAEAKSWILYGDGKGQFRTVVFTTGHGWHEGRLADVDGDGRLDIAGKPYTWNAPRLDVWLNRPSR